MMLYQPTPTEIATVVNNNVAHQPTLTTRWQKAGELLTANALYFTPTGWRCESQQKGGSAYAVDFTHCSCADFAAANAQVKGVTCCKHKLALTALVEIAAQHIDLRLLGTYVGSADVRRVAALAPDAGLLLVNHRPNPYVVYVPACAHTPTRVCYTRWASYGQRPAAEADLDAFLAWLNTAKPLTRRPSYTEFEPTPREWAPTYTQAQSRHWLATGEAPSLADIPAWIR